MRPIDADALKEMVRVECSELANKQPTEYNIRMQKMFHKVLCSFVDNAPTIEVKEND